MALPASCDVATENHASVRNAIRCSVIALAKLRISQSRITASHSGATLDTRGHDPRTSTMLGATMWNEIAATNSIRIRGMLKRRSFRFRPAPVVLNESRSRGQSMAPPPYTTAVAHRNRPGV